MDWYKQCVYEDSKYDIGIYVGWIWNILIVRQVYMMIIMGSGYHFYFMYKMYCDGKL